MADRPPAPLHYFAFYPADWLSSPAVRRMTLSQRGRFMDLLCLAWGNGEREPSLEAVDMKAAAALVKGQFMRREDGRYYNAKLSDVWIAGQEAHAKAVRRGEASGRARAAKQSKGETVSKQSRNGLEQAPLDMVLREGRDSLSRGAGAVPDGGPAPASSGVRERREAGGGSWMRDLIPKIAGGQ